MPASKRSINFGMTADQSFSFEGIVAELDLKHGKPVNSDNPDDYDVHYVYLGGLDGLRADSSGTRRCEDRRPPRIPWEGLAVSINVVVVPRLPSTSRKTDNQNPDK